MRFCARVGRWIGMEEWEWSDAAGPVGGLNGLDDELVGDGDGPDVGTMTEGEACAALGPVGIPPPTEDDVTVGEWVVGG